jgi:hypothetical protein
MKNIFYTKLAALFIIFSLFATSCDTDFANPNNPTEDIIFGSKDGLFALSVGINQYFSTTALRQAIEAPGITTRELGVTNTFLNINDLARGGTNLEPLSGGITNPWVTLLRAKGMAESLIANVDNADLAGDTRNSLLAFGNFYKAMCLGHLIQMFEQVPINNSPDGAAPFSDRATVLAECIRLLEEARNAISGGVSSEFQSDVLGPDRNLLNSINAFHSRYSLMAGNYNAAISSADAVLNSGDSPSMFAYDANNVNPIWNRTVNSADLNPQKYFGLDTTSLYLPEDGDGRVDFYLGADAGKALSDAGNQPLSEMLGFFTTATSPIPIYLQGELMLNKAEAYARSNDLSNAVSELNKVRMKTDDPLGVNANLPAWGGDTNNQGDILEEIYKNRAIEMFLTGMRFEYSRRFHPNIVDPNTQEDVVGERNRNYYPYPTLERENNPNTPPDPAI